MKILWIEDFGPRLSRSELIEEIFDEFFTEINLGDELDPERLEIGAQLSDLFSKHTLHEIYVCESYVDWREVDAQHRGDFDLVLIDIRLDSSATPAKERPKGFDNPTFDKKAGFYIYNQLIRRGFPDDHIAFFTAEGQSLKQFGEYCGGILQEKPAHCFQKNPTHFKRLRQWLADRATQQSLILRRGVLDGCRMMKKKIDEMDSSELSSQMIFYKTIPGKLNEGAEALRRDSLEYLSRLERMFIPAQYYENSDLPRAFTLELVGKWEESWGVFIRAKETPQFGSWLESQFHRSAQLQLKTLRNWSNHRQLSFNLTAKELAYFFLLAMRALVERDLNEIFKYEQILSTLFTPVSELELHRQLNSGFEFRLEHSYETLKSLRTDILRHIDEPSREKMRPISYDRKMENYFLTLLQETGDAAKWLKIDSRKYYLSRIREASISLFYQSFWHGLFPMEVPTKYYANLERVKFSIKPLPQSFISFLGRAILKESFKDSDVTVSAAWPVKS